MASSIAKRLRKHQQQRIKRQVTPEVQSFTPPRPQPLRVKKGRINQEMFTKLCTAKYMKAKVTNNNTGVEFTRQVQRMVCEIARTSRLKKPGILRVLCWGWIRMILRLWRMTVKTAKLVNHE
ncbi:phage virion morphogenesis protein [Rahnella sp. R3(2024)]|uniref:phage virion morphogenesis protein n=1 Tax=Rahnella sp. R3(2024) TaxID=3163550 RepID=UPI0036E95FCF